MDIFMKSLFFDKECCWEDLLEPCVKILRLFESAQKNALSKHNLEIMLKGTIFLNESFQMFGYRLENELLLKNDTLIALADTFKTSRGIDLACNEILGSKFSICHIPLVDKLLRIIFTEDQLVSKLTRVAMSEFLNYEESIKYNRNKMIALLQRLSAVHPEKIDTIFEQLIKEIKFNIIGYIFLEPHNGSHHLKCKVFENKICSLLLSKRINFSFFRSIYLLSSTSDNGLQFFTKTLESAAFSKSLLTYFVEYIRSEFNDGEVENTNDLTNVYRNNYFPFIMYVINTSLERNARCRSLFYKNNNFSQNTKNYINKLAFVYDY